MMLMPGKAKMSSVILEKLGSSKDSLPDMEAPESDASTGKLAAADKMISCLKSGDAKGLAAALGDFIDMHTPEEPAEVE